MLAARTRPEPARRRPRSAWVLLGQVAPELGEWATFFAAGAAKRAAAEAGLSHAVTEREADDLVRDVGGLPRRGGEQPRRRCPSRARVPRVVGGTASGRRPPGPAVNDPFVHLHVASGYSMQYGANHPADLVTRAAEHGMSALALTDRDGLYGAVKFALACRSAGVRPIFGVDLAVAPALGHHVAPGRSRTALGGEESGAARRRGCARRRCGRAPPAAGRASTRGCRGSPSSPGTAPAGARCAG